MSDDKTPEGGSKELEEGKTGDTPSSSYARLKASNEELSTKVDELVEKHEAQERYYQKEMRLLKDANKEPKEDGERIANLEVQLARSRAVSKFGLSEDDADLLKGTPDEILADAEYWADRLKDNKPVDKKTEDKTNREVIDDKINDDKDKAKSYVKPAPVKGNLTWMEQYRAANPAERFKMDEDVQKGLVDPTK